ncbi:MAG: hypothetical protein Q4F41_01485 [Eubacteriales bacterium]|nr:hypothetical protein [Eubacteriales bacterium]
MKLDGIIVIGKEVLYDHFSFKGVWQAIEPVSAPYRETLKDFPKSIETLQIHALLNYLENPKTWTCPAWVRNLRKDGTVDEHALKTWLGSLKKADFWEKNQQAIRELIQSGGRPFSPRATALLCLFLLLHIQAGREIGEPEADRLSSGNWDLEELNHFTAIEFMKRRLLRENLLEQSGRQKWGIWNLTEESPEFTLPYWKGTGQPDAPLELVKLVHHGKTPLLLILEGTSLTRQLFPEEWIYAIRKGSCYVDFLPRFTVSEDTCLTLRDGKLTAYESGGKEIPVSMKFAEPPASWAFDEAFGILAVGEQGELSIRSLDPMEPPEKRAVFASLFSHTYGLLLEDGSIRSNCWDMQGWSGMLAFTLGLNHAAAIREDRSLALTRGSIPEASGDCKAASVRVYEEHVIWLDTRGSIHTEQKKGRAWKSFPGAAAVEVCQSGYLIAWEKGIYRIPFGNGEGKGEEETPLVKENRKITEMAASDTLLVYRTLDDCALHSFLIES